MKKLIATILLLTLCLTCLSATAFAATTVNVRSGPGLGYRVLGVVYGGTTLPSLGGVSYDSRGVAWYSVSYKGMTGWVSSKYATSSDYSYSGASYGSAVRATGDVNVRTGAGLGYGALGTLYKGHTASYLGSTRYDSRGVAWYKVSFHGSTGWVSSTYASLY